MKIVGEAQLEAFKKAMGQAWNWIDKFHDGIISVASVLGVFFLPAIAKSIIGLGTEGVGAFGKGIAAVIQYGAASWKSLASTEANI